ncbi:MAG TPA: hypothetical protein VF874_01740, partial [Mycobacterium sp.]
AAATVERIRPRRAICSSPAGCGRSHVLLPRFCLGRRGGGDLGGADGPGRRLGVAADHRGGGSSGLDGAGLAVGFDAHAEPVRVGFARLKRHVNAGADMDRLAPAASRVADAVAQIGSACAAVRRGNRWWAARVGRQRLR